MQTILDQIVNTLREQLNSNQFLSGGFTLMLIGGLVATCRKLPGQLWSWIVHRVFIEFEVPLNDDAFWWINDWLAEHNYCKRWARWLTVRTTSKGLRNSGKPRVILSPAPGRHVMFWHGRPLIVRRHREENQNSSSNGSVAIPRETFTVSIMTWRRSMVMDLLEEARAVSEPPDDKRVKIHVPHYGGEWTVEAKRRPRPLDSVVMAEGLLESLIDRIRTFMDSETWYSDRGIPYRLGVLFYGPPGNGKSSTVLAIASHLGLNICVINLGTSSLGDDDLRSLFADVPEDTIVLIEDIDCVFNQREGVEDKDNRVTFSGLLNAIDGVMASEGRILIMTTNHIERLDPALIRPGRCDIRVKIDNASADQATRIFKRFFPDHEALALHFGEQVGPKNVSMAAVQNHLLKYSDRDPHAAVSHISELFVNESQETNEVSH